VGYGIATPQIAGTEAAFQNSRVERVIANHENVINQAAGIAM
jgi:hypothetical protein